MRPLFRVLTKKDPWFNHIAKGRILDERLSLGCAICEKDVLENPDALFIYINNNWPIPWPKQQWVCSEICGTTLMLQLS